MKYAKKITTLVKSLAFGAVVMTTMAFTANAQNTNEEYREWREAQRRAQEERRDYMRTRSRSDYRDWQEAQREAREEYNEYLRANRNYNRNYNDRYDNRYYNNNRRYRVYRNGSYYSTDYRGAELLRTAVHNGYNQGYRQGQIDRQYGRGYNYGSDVYRSGSYGYQSYVARNQYQYYFQQGFQRGYEDGYNSTSRYGTRAGNGFNVLGNVLSGILNFIDD